MSGAESLQKGYKGRDVRLFEEEVTSNPKLINIESIRIEQVPVSRAVSLQPRMSKAVWRPAPGRKLAFIIRHDQDLLGVAFLASPVINMGARDEALRLSKDPSEKGRQLRNYADLSACVPAQPFGWYWNGGKMIALLATTLGDYWFDRYGDELNGIVTTSLWGRGSQYNRVYKFLGYTKGYGHLHISDEQYQNMLSWMRDNDVDIPSSRFGAGSNPRMRRIQAYLRASGDKSFTLQHGQKRGIYYHDSVAPAKRLEMLSLWYERWGKPRYERKQNEHPPYWDGLT
jgi:hypothetical protein